MASAKLTPIKKKRFIDELRVSGNITLAARVSDINRRLAYLYRDPNNRLFDAKFTAAWDSALEEHLDIVEEEARRRAVVGTERPVFQGGKLVGHIREYSDILLIFMLKAGRPKKYRDNYPDDKARQLSDVTFKILLPDDFPTAPSTEVAPHE